MENNLNEVIGRHEKIALQLSGGRDSIACIYLMRAYWDRLTVYWLNTGASYPETIKAINIIRALVPNFVEIDGDQPAVIDQFGLPSDIVPVSATPMGQFVSGEVGPLIQDRYSCCARTMMIPLHNRMIADGITLIVRGQKQADRLKSRVRSGDVQAGIEYLFPLEDWSTRQVMDFMRKEDAPITRFYEMLDGTPDCMTCSAWWEEGAAKYLKRYHPDTHTKVQARLDVINQAVGSHIAAFNVEVET